ncbi:MAG TPA: HAMP domain-containing sensor histidine kinase [Solirubrobacteraceae bacterium]
MSLRKRLSLIAAASVAVAVLLAALVCYFVVRSQLRNQIDATLENQAALVSREGAAALGNGQFTGLPASAGGRAPYAQIVAANGAIIQTIGPLRLPVSGTVRAVAAGRLASAMSDAGVGGTHIRVYTFHEYALAPDGQTPLSVAIELGRPLKSTDQILGHLRLVLFLLVVSGIALAAFLGRVAARRVLAPLAEVAHAAEHIGATEDLTSRLRIHADDEVGQLATRFNAMLDRLESSRTALDDSVRAQRQLVADASHELRTPVTSLRTNIEVLLAEAELEPEDRRRLLADVVEQSEELTALVGDLIDLARGDQPGFATEDVSLDRIADEAVARARRNAPGIEFTTRLQAVSMDGVAARLERAINNLLDNAARHSPPGGRVELTVDADGVEVRDHGHGVPEADLPYVFDRFFRGAGARGRQGSGLGLAIVRQVTEQHGGTATAANAPDGGAVFRLHLPVVAKDPAPSEFSVHD